jgi:hypothetical protein
MKMMKLVILAFALNICSVFAALPTVEGLFRNGANADVAGDTIAISFIIEKLNPESETQDMTSVDPVFVKVIFSLNENEPIRMMQILYTNEGMENNSAIDMTTSSNLVDQIRKDSPVERKLLYSFLMMYGLNSSEGMNSVLKRVSPDYRTNREMINVDKRDLYRRYMSFLRNRGRTDNISTEDVSPLRPTDKEELERVNEILSKKYFMESDAVSLARQKGSFYWEVRLENVVARFTHRDHRLRSLSMGTIDGILQVAVGDFVMFNGVHELPKIMNWILPSGDAYRFIITAHQDFVSRNRTFGQRVQEYERAIETNRSRLAPITSPIRQVYLY